MNLSTAAIIGIVIWGTYAQVPASVAGEPQPLLGIKVKDLRTFQASAIAKSDYPQESGVLISYVHPDGPAEEAGLEEYDIIASSGDTQFETAGDFIEWLKTTSDGKRYPLVIWRREDEQWAQRQVFYRAEWGIRDDPIAQGAAWDGPLSAQIAEPIVYIASSEKSTLWSDGTEFVTVQYEGHVPVEGFCNVEGVPTRVFMKSSDEKILKVSYAELTLADIAKLNSRPQQGEETAKDPDAPSKPQDLYKGPPRFRFYSAGDVQITVEVGKRKVAIPLQVKYSPVSPGDSADHIIKSVGLPDWKNEVTVFWPDSEHVDRFFYSPSATDSFIGASHWRYRKYPGLVLSIQGGVLQEISSDHIGIPTDETEKSPDGLRRWTIKSGRTVDASFVRLRRGLVTLKEASGNTKDVKLTDLSDSDRDYIRRKVRDVSESK